jgi:lactoylglutathione lyase
MLKFAWTIIYVKDVIATIEFYEKAFGFKKKFVAPGDEFGEINSGETSIGFSTIKLLNEHLPGGFIASDIAAKPFGVELAFTTTDVEKHYNEAIAAGAVAVTPVEVKPWGQTVGYVRDMNGILVEICTPVG